eukprot:3623069-Pyramimonas_sp.AAC.2
MNSVYTTSSSRLGRSRHRNPTYEYPGCMWLFTSTSAPASPPEEPIPEGPGGAIPEEEGHIPSE